ncbi:hypothetical protein EXIGLDRAFT_24530 [Exidia glandulosa HHB12029]|uniref:Uncharacterized protein n=1 Tax=Exidia glandulosa HHB12029 TaxID=1314781 RepID=A0A165R299_EXIGL|nr:hypothetical protein EXIGLDRAFT_24530 [Exidia glandulosa HHB12029]
MRVSSPEAHIPAVPTGTKRSPPSLPSLPTREDSKLAAELESALAGDEDADGEADDDFDLVEVQPAASQGAAYDAYDDEEDFASLALPAPGKGKGVARANAATAKAKSKAKAPPRGKKRARDVDDDFEAVPIPAPVPARAPKRRKSSPVPPPPPPSAPQRRISQTHPSTAQRPEDLLVPPPRPEPHYTSSEDEADMFEEVIPELNGHVNGNGNGHVEDVNGQLEDTELVEVIDDMEEVGVDEYDFLAQELEAEMEADPEADVFGDVVEEYEDQEQEQEVYDDGYVEYDGEQGHVNGNGHMNGNGNGHGAPISMNDYANANGGAFLLPLHVAKLTDI